MSDFSQTTERVQALILQLQQGKPGVQEQLLEVAQNRLRILARQMLKHFSRIRHLEDTDDLLQKTLIRLNQSLRTLRPVSAQAFFSLSSQQMRWCLIDMARSYKIEGQLREEYNDDPDKKATRQRTHDTR